MKPVELRGLLHGCSATRVCYRAKFEIDDLSYPAINPQGILLIAVRQNTVPTSLIRKALAILLHHSGYDRTLSLG